MSPARIAELLAPYITGLELPPAIYAQLQAYLDLLLRWNARTNLTAIREPEAIVTRHFGESLFAAGVLFATARQDSSPIHTLADLGSGAGFPGLPIKLAYPGIHVTLIESQNKKATFLKELIRTLGLEAAEVYSGRAEQWGKTADVVTLRAVERFRSALPAAANMVGDGGYLCLLISAAQVAQARAALATGFAVAVETAVPGSIERILLVARKCTR